MGEYITNTATEPQQAHLSENLWGYAKRLSFLTDQIERHYASAHRGEIRVLDIGCGNGSQLAIPLAESGYPVTGVDPDRASIDRAQAAAVAGARFFCCLVTDLPAETFHVVILSEVLEHLSKPQELLHAAMAYLQKGGLLIVTTPNGYGPFEIDSWLYRHLHLDPVFQGFFKAMRRLRRRPDPVSPIGSTDNLDGHLQFFTRGRLHRMFAEKSPYLATEAPASFLCGPIVSHLVGRFPSFIRWNAKITDSLPLALASGWYFAVTNRE